MVEDTKYGEALRQLACVQKSPQYDLVRIVCLKDIKNELCASLRAGDRAWHAREANFDQYQRWAIERYHRLHNRHQELEIEAERLLREKDRLLTQADINFGIARYASHETIARMWRILNRTNEEDVTQELRSAMQPLNIVLKMKLCEPVLPGQACRFVWPERGALVFVWPPPDYDRLQLLRCRGMPGRFILSEDETMGGIEFLFPNNENMLIDDSALLYRCDRPYIHVVTSPPPTFPGRYGPGGFFASI